MSTILSYSSQMFSLLGSYFTPLTSHVVIAGLISLLVGIPLILSMLRRHIF